MKNQTLHLWSKTDIAALLGIDRKILSDLIKPETKESIKYSERTFGKVKKKTYTLEHVSLILKDVYPFLSDQERLKILLPKHFK
jgi:hypothetical protein